MKRKERSYQPLGPDWTTEELDALYADGYKLAAVQRLFKNARRRLEAARVARDTERRKIDDERLDQVLR